MTEYTKFDSNIPPPPLMTSEPDSFAQNTIATRKPNIIKQILTDHIDVYPPEIVQNLESLIEEIESKQPVKPLKTTAPDGPDWHAAWQPYQGKSWFSIPWYFAEVFFYRRLLEITGYFGSKIDTVNRWQGIDPFLPQKQRELAEDGPWQVLNAALGHSNDNTNNSFRAILHHCVWGNRVDLSYNKVAQETGREISVDSEKANLLVDDTEAVLAHLMPSQNKKAQPGTTAPQRKIDFICDNSGTELLLDLALADFFLCFGWAKQVTLHVKYHPFFVSDAIPADVEATIDAIKTKTDLPLVSQLGDRLAKYRQSGQLVVRDEIFWNSSKFFWQMPQQLSQGLALAQLVIVKGDANYRRILGDSCWPPAVPMSNVAPYFPAPFAALRTMKSDPVVGLQPGQAQALDKEDALWRVNGKRGLIQALLP